MGEQAARQTARQTAQQGAQQGAWQGALPTRDVFIRAVLRFCEASRAFDRVFTAYMVHEQGSYETVAEAERQHNERRASLIALIDACVGPDGDGGK
jgi:hypothetical protein